MSTKPAYMDWRTLGRVNGEYKKTLRFDLRTIYIRKGDSAILAAAYPRRVNTWIRAVIAEHCDELLRRQGKKRKPKEEYETKREWIGRRNQDALRIKAENRRLRAKEVLQAALDDRDL